MVSTNRGFGPLGSHSGPGFDVIKGGAEADDPLLKSPMAFTKLGIARLGNKVGLDGFEEVALIALEST